ncbi:hypothetical protein CBM2637_A110014 [Cupriavidus taiwanensis]|nr:hypothetical protein CBM2637_A110014 [Cupriavidus taiwanensis]
MKSWRRHRDTDVVGRFPTLETGQPIELPAQFSEHCLRSFGDKPRRIINQGLAQLANCKTKVNQGNQRPTQPTIGAI